MYCECRAASLAPASKHSTCEDDRYSLQGSTAKRAASSTLVPEPGHCSQRYIKSHKRHMSIHQENSVKYACRKEAIIVTKSVDWSLHSLTKDKNN